jgi:hypothetical protein
VTPRRITQLFNICLNWFSMPHLTLLGHIHVTNMGSLSRSDHIRDRDIPTLSLLMIALDVYPSRARNGSAFRRRPTQPRGPHARIRGHACTTEAYAAIGWACARGASLRRQLQPHERKSRDDLEILKGANEVASLGTETPDIYWVWMEQNISASELEPDSGGDEGLSERN